MKSNNYRKLQPRRRDINTQQNFRKHMQPPMRSQKSFESASTKTQATQKPHLPLSATNWCLYDTRTATYIGVRDEQQREVASLTKIMTTILGLQLFDRYQMDRDIMIRISYSSAALNGTSAQLRANKYIRIYDLFYGAMLPSGNDAAFLLAEVFGLLLFYENLKPQTKDYSQIESIDLTCYDSTTTFVNRFLKEMNKKAKQVNLRKTNFNNPHGLANILNVSTAKDMLTLSRYAAKNPLFAEIMDCQQFQTEFFDSDMETVNCIKRWTNTNKLLGLGWSGIKTGVTQPAGGCLASLREGVFIIVLGSVNREARFDDTLILWEWHQQQHQMKQ